MVPGVDAATDDAQMRNDWAEHPWVDWMITGIIVGAHAFIALQFEVGDVLLWASNGRRAMVYTTTAGVASLVAGIGTIALAQYKAASGPRISAIKERAGAPISAGLRATLVAPLVAAGLCIVTLTLDTTRSDAGGTRFLFEVAFVLGALRLIRLVYLFTALDDIKTVDDTETPKAPRAEVNRRLTTHGAA